MGKTTGKKKSRKQKNATAQAKKAL